jgi:hypothetical protein
MQFDLEPTLNPTFLVYGGGFDYRQTGNVPAGSWNHFVGTWQTNQRVRCWLNGKESTAAPTGAAVSSLQNGTKPFAIGGVPDATTYAYTADISQTSIFNRALTPTEIQRLYNQPLCMIDDSVEILTSSTNIGVATISDPTTNSRFNQTSGFFSYDHY